MCTISLYCCREYAHIVQYRLKGLFRKGLVRYSVVHTSCTLVALVVYIVACTPPPRGVHAQHNCNKRMQQGEYLPLDRLATPEVLLCAYFS